MPNVATRLADTWAGVLSLSDTDGRIRGFEAADHAFGRKLFHEERAAQFRPLGLSDAVLGSLLDQQYDAQRTAYAHRFPDAEHFIIEYDGTDVGRLIATLEVAPANASYSTLPTARSVTLHLIDITLASSARNRGIGSEVIDSLARAGHAIGAASFTLFVLHTNIAAQRLYERLGFVAVADGVHVLMQRAMP